MAEWVKAKFAQAEDKVAELKAQAEEEAWRRERLAWEKRRDAQIAETERIAAIPLIPEDVVAAAEAGDVAKVKAWLATPTGHVRVRTDHTKGMTVLILAARRGQLEVMRAVIAAGADVNERDLSRTAPLHYACLYEQPEAAALLLDHGADVDAAAFHGFSAIMFAAQYGDVKTINVLLGHKAKFWALNDQNEDAEYIAKMNYRVEAHKVLKAAKKKRHDAYLARKWTKPAPGS